MDDKEWRELGKLGSAEELERVRAALSPEGRSEFDRLWQELRSARHDLVEADRIAEWLLQLRTSTLPGEPPKGKRLASGQGAQDAEIILSRLFDAVDPPEDSVATLQQRVRDWLLSVPAVDAARVPASTASTASTGTGRPELIRLPRSDGAAQCPVFQFAADGTPIQIVLRINELLDATRDPWGAAGWWLGPSRWFPDPPAEMIGAVPDARLLAAAQASFEGEW